jgi:hypothetical protein
VGANAPTTGTGESSNVESCRVTSIFSLWARNSVPMPGLLKVQSGLLRAPFERHLDVPGECFCSKTGRLPALHDGLNDIRRQESQADQASYIAHAEPLARSDLSQRFRLSGADLVEPAMCPGQRLSAAADRRSPLKDCGRRRLAAAQRRAVSAALETIA